MHKFYSFLEKDKVVKWKLKIIKREGLNHEKD